jgi:hypothetical protein
MRPCGQENSRSLLARRHALLPDGRPGATKEIANRFSDAIIEAVRLSNPDALAPEAGA